MAGGELRTALQRDMMQSERGGNRRLGWYGRGSTILVGVARGLAYLHEQRVRAGSSLSHGTGPCVPRACSSLFCLFATFTSPQKNSKLANMFCLFDA